MKEILENIFAVEVPDGLLSPEFVLEQSLVDIIYGNEGDGELVIRHTLPQCGSPIGKITINITPGSYEILFTTKSCTEGQAAGVLDRQHGRGFYKDYSLDGSYAKYGTYTISTPSHSLYSLLRSKNLNPGLNYLIIRKK